MLMAYKDRKYRRSRTYLESFRHAFSGLKTAFIEERNLRFHLVAAILVLFCGVFFHITKDEWLVLLICILIVMALELVNTAVERAVDAATDHFMVEAKKAKDVAAGAVLLGAVISSIIGLVIFIPYIWQWLN
ncbi:diacylglycerol kinase family protein [Listeria ilorinensis]|uniref:diacylglycerol kinase family protein n=1 Tax=Listeria ilorinensis TaxID=2867439 RepID=UPI001EF63868|nr:diacylglycerol kinase family protein [Listeria ilorinensis]